MNERVVRPLPPGDGARDAGSRGRTVLSERVLEKIAGQVAGEVSFAGGSSGGFLGVGGHADFSVRPTASVELAGNIAALSVSVALRYPVPLRQATEQLRQRIIDRVEALTGVQVRQVDINIAWLLAGDGVHGHGRLL
jgi:uncharacterized alkaline shock family protein YloU